MIRNYNPDNQRYKTAGGNPTDDRVFLLSIDEAEKYFESNRDRGAEATKYAIAKGSFLDDNGMGWWWLRSPGGQSLDAACVAPGGGVSVLGSIVSIGGVAVRPALWLNL